MSALWSVLPTPPSRKWPMSPAYPRPRNTARSQASSRRNWTADWGMATTQSVAKISALTSPMRKAPLFTSPSMICIFVASKPTDSSWQHVIPVIQLCHHYSSHFGNNKYLTNTIQMQKQWIQHTRVLNPIDHETSGSLKTMKHQAHIATTSNSDADMTNHISKNGEESGQILNKLEHILNRYSMLLPSGKGTPSNKQPACQLNRQLNKNKQQIWKGQIRQTRGSYCPETLVPLGLLFMACILSYLFFD